jgi:peptidoglycan/xylan/chitin deacetylase (PgdA/CDA1 family)
MTKLPIAAATLTAAAAAWTYAALSRGSQIFGKTIIDAPNPAQIALTFDDGPNDLATERLLEILALHNVHATFFMIGDFVRQRPAIARAVAAAGHTIGNHTMTHPWLAWQSSTRVRQELRDTNALIQDTICAPIHLFRPPHGARRPYVLRVARDLGLTTVQWNVIAEDWKPVPAEVILERLQRGIGHNRRNGRSSNLLLHDGGHLSLGQPRLPTVEATARLLDLCRNTSTKFVTPHVWIDPPSKLSS